MRYNVFYLVHSGPPLQPTLRVKNKRIAYEMAEFLKKKGALVVQIERIHEDKIVRDGVRRKARFWL